jgi:hypothetical protein
MCCQGRTSRSERQSAVARTFDAVFTAEGIRTLASPQQAPRAKAICGRMIGPMRREVTPAVHKESPPSLTLRDQNIVHFRRGISH